MPAETEPIAYDALVGPAAETRFANLRTGQEAVLQRYAASEHVRSDLAIELPTGAGKTLIALLILEYRRQQGHKVAILTGNKTLARQIVGEAEALGVPIVRFEGRGAELPAGDLRRYKRAQAIAVMNYWVYIQQNPTVEAADYLVLDDAQLAEGALTSLYTVSIGRYQHPSLFDSTMRLFAHETPSSVADDYVKELAIGPTAFKQTDLLAFPYLRGVQDNLKVLIDDYLDRRPDGESDAIVDLYFRWGRFRAKLGQSLCFLSADEIELRPVCFPTQDYPHLSAAKQRIYMSATLHDAGDLQRRLGSRRITKLSVPADVSTEQDGRRLFVFNQHAALGVRSQVPEDVLSPLRELLELTRKSVWLCTSGGEADQWYSWLAGASTEDDRGKRTSGLVGHDTSGAPIWRLSPTGDELDAFRVAPEGHLLIAGRFEGMDFPDDVCRLAVFPSLPSGSGLLERFTTEQLRDATYQRMRVLERVKQGIGRCTRGDADYAVYYFLDPRFYSEMESRDFGAIVSERTRRQVEIGLELTEDGMGGVVPFAREFLGGNFSQFDSREGAASPPRPSRDIVLDTTAEDEVLGWLALYNRHDYANAATRFEHVVRGLQDREREHRAFWEYQQAFAEFLRHAEDQGFGALERAIELLELAKREGASSSWFNRLARVTNLLRAEREVHHDREPTAIFDVWDQLVEQHPYHSGRFLRWQSRLQSHLAGTHAQAAEAMEVIGTLLGFRASRPSGNGAPDGLWRDSDSSVTIEAKIETERDAVVLSDVNQADGQRRAASVILGVPEDFVDGLIVTNLGEIDRTASPALGRLRIVSTSVMEQVRARLQEILADYWRTWSRGNASARLTARAAAERRLPPRGWLHRAILNVPGPFLQADELMAEWPR